MDYYIINSIIIHNMGQKVCHLYFYDNFGKCRPILTGSIAIWRNVPHTLRSNAVNKVQRSVLSTSCDSRISFTTSVARHETDESHLRVLAPCIKICPLGDVWGNQELPVYILGPPHISETNRARKLKFGTLAGICRYYGYI